MQDIVFLSVPQLAAELGLDPSTVYRRVQREDVTYKPDAYNGRQALFAPSTVLRIKEYEAGRLAGSPSSPSSPTQVEG
ncbi:AsnC family protein [Tessaracoccus massiliensis]|uniref:AsnC family protein n=1 Tax=Tessaracoccus massiliensis TaxID=1522311 RepID=UPI00058C26B3|nr:AsnC family protein [Tessaracoccus massiliensis]